MAVNKIIIKVDGVIEDTLDFNKIVTGLADGAHTLVIEAYNGETLIDTQTRNFTKVTANVAPSSVDDNYNVVENEILTVSAQEGVLSNDSDSDGDSITAILVSDVSNGTLTLNSDGSFEYTPNVDYVGSDSFTYKTNDGTVDGNTATVTINITSSASILDITSISGTVPSTTLALPSSDGQNQGTHPDVLDFGTQWNGYRYWMAYTPYTDGLEAQENPEIVASNDLDTWVVPTGLTNPITPFPGGSRYWADTELIYDDINNRLICYYRGFDTAADVAGTAYIEAKHSTDGVNWSNAIAVLDNATITGASPAIIKVGSNYEFYDIDIYQTPRKLTKRISSDPLDFNSSSVIELDTLNIPSGRDLWHVNIEVFNDIKYVLMTLCDAGQSGQNSNTHMGYIDSNNDCILSATPIFTRQNGTWYSDNIYRCAMILSSSNGQGATFDYFMSGTSGTGDWTIGRTQLTIPYQSPTTLTLSAVEATTPTLSGTDIIGGFGINNDLSEIYFASWGTSGSTTDSKIRQFPLSTPQDLSTVGTEKAGFITSNGNQISNPVFSPDGTTMIHGLTTGTNIFRYSLSTGYEVDTASFVYFSGVGQSARALYFSADGLRFWISMATTNIIREYSVPEAYDIPNAVFVKSYTYTDSAAGFTDITYSDDGLMLVGSDQVAKKLRVIRLSEAYNISSVISEENFVLGSDDYNSIAMIGTKIYIYNIQQRYVEQRNLS